MSHDTDFYTWTQEQAALLRQGQFNNLDIANLIEEIEDMGRSEKRELESRLAVLLMHLLKWQYQAIKRSNSWSATIETQRLDLKKLLTENPSLKYQLSNYHDEAYRKARLLAVQETNLNKSVFPSTSPWSLEQVFDDDFWPE